MGKPDVVVNRKKLCCSSGCGKVNKVRFLFIDIGFLFVYVEGLISTKAHMSFISLVSHHLSLITFCGLAHWLETWSHDYPV